MGVEIGSEVVDDDERIGYGRDDGDSGMVGVGEIGVEWSSSPPSI